METIIDWKQKKQDDSKKLIAYFSNLVNGGADIDAILNQFEREHRTLQQSMFSVMMKIILHVSKDEYQTDGRNEYMKKTAQDLVKGYGEIFEAKEVKYYQEEIGYGEVEAREKAKKSRQSFDKNIEMYFNMPCI